MHCEGVMPDWMKDLLQVQWAADDDGAGGAGGGSEDDGNADDQDGEGDDKKDGLKSALDKEREARKAAERELRAVNKRLADLENAGRSDTEKLAAERDALKARTEKLAATVRQANGKEAVRSAAKESGAPDPDLIYRLVKSDIDFDDDDEPTNVDRLILGAKKEFPELFKVKPGKADAGGEGAKAPKRTNDMNTWIRQAAGRG